MVPCIIGKYVIDQRFQVVLAQLWKGHHAALACAYHRHGIAFVAALGDALKRRRVRIETLHVQPVAAAALLPKEQGPATIRAALVHFHSLYLNNVGCFNGIDVIEIRLRVEGAAAPVCAAVKTGKEDRFF